MYHYVYQIMSLTPDENGVLKIYSGLRSCECLPEEDDYMGSGHAIRGAIEKYGKDKFMKLIIGKFSTRAEAHDYETQWLSKQFDFHGRDWKKFRKFHYNLRLNENSHDGGSMSPETRAKLSEAMTGKYVGENHPFFGKQHSDEYKKKMSAANSGEKNPMFGKQRSDETKKKISEAQIGNQLSDEHKKKISEALSGENNPNFGKTGAHNPKFKGFSIGTNRDNKTIALCGTADMKSRGFHPAHISQVILGKLPHHKGFTFTRTSDPDQLRGLLNTATFYDEESKERIQEFLSQ